MKSLFNTLLLINFLLGTSISVAYACEKQDAIGSWVEYSNSTSHANEPCYFNKGKLVFSLKQNIGSDRNIGDIRYKEYIYNLGVVKDGKSYSITKYAQNDEVGINIMDVIKLDKNLYQITLEKSSKDLLHNKWMHNIEIYFYNDSKNSIFYSNLIADSRYPATGEHSVLNFPLDYGVDTQNYDPKTKTYTYNGRVFNKKDGYNAKSAQTLNFAFKLTSDDTGFKCLYVQYGKNKNPVCDDSGWSTRKLVPTN